MLGSIHWVVLPAVNGHEQHGRRPGILLQVDQYANLPVVLVVPLTTSKSALRFPGTVLINPTPENGLRQQSIALVFQLRAVDRTRIAEPLGKLSPEEVLAIHNELDKLTGRSVT
jgi:mRNA interferase MazF